MTGRRLPLSWPGKLRRSKHLDHQNTYSLLDAAALATTKGLDFSDVDNAPDFTALSFYKIFGFPDLGALIIRKNSGHILEWRKYFGGGTVDMVVVLKEPWHSSKQQTLHDRLEDGTLPFHNIIALGNALDVHEKLYGSMDQISRHTAYLGRRLYEGISSLRHANNRPLCQVYKEDGIDYTDSTTQGGTIAFNVMNADGSYVGHADVEKIADKHDIYVRAGGLCNPGGVATYLGLAPWQMKRSYSAGHRCGDDISILNCKPTGVVRASVGAMTTIADVDKFLIFLEEAFGQKAEPPHSAINLPSLAPGTEPRSAVDWLTKQNAMAGPSG